MIEWRNDLLSAMLTNFYYCTIALKKLKNEKSESVHEVLDKHHFEKKKEVKGC